MTKEEWNSYLSNLENENEIKNHAVLRMATDIELFANRYFPHYCKYPFNQFHSDVFSSNDFTKRAVKRVRAAPRGYAKSTISALIKPIHDVCYGLEKYIIVISNTSDQANQKLADIRSEVLTNDALAADFGIHFPNRKPGESQYVLYCGSHACRFESYGAGAEIRGLRFGADRPTKIVCDDVEHSEEVLNEAIRKKYEDWYREVVSKLGSNETNIEFIGTVLHRDSLLRGLLKNPAYDAKVYKSVISWSHNAVLWDKWTQIYTDLDNPTRVADSEKYYLENETKLLEGTDVLWKEKESYLWLMKELIEIGRRAFMKEKQNEPLGGDEALFEKFHWYRETDKGFLIESNGILIPWSKLKGADGKWLNAYGALDPATGQTKAKAGKLGDFSCILTGIKDSMGRLFVHKDWTKRAAPTKFISEIFEHHLIFDYQKFGCEVNLYRNLLIPNIIAERQRIEQETKKVIRLPLYAIENVENKEKRIYTLEPKISHGWILLNRTISEEFKSQLETFPHLDHEDCLDTLEMLYGLVHGRYKASPLSIDPMGGR